LDDPLEILAAGMPGGSDAKTISARPEMMFSGVPTSCAMPEASFPATASVSERRSCCSRSKACSPSATTTLTRLVEALRHAVEGLRQFAELVVAASTGSGGPRRPSPSARIDWANCAKGRST
jgi:hypothetical protein